MLKVIIPIIGSILLSSCFETVKEDSSANYKKVTPNASGVVIEDRGTSTREHLAQNDGGNFKSQGGADATGATTSAADKLKKIAIANLKNSGVKFVLYFPYDDAEIDETATQEIIKHVNFMRDNAQLTLRLEGHADERGTREYNLALGENRALSIKEVLSLYDLSSRVEVVSFGEERPIAKTHNESAWQQNRRVEFIYQ